MTRADNNAGRPASGAPDHAIEELIKRVERLETELMLLRAERISERIDSGEEHTIPSEVARRVFVEDIAPVRAFREWRGLTQEELAMRIGVSKSYISQLETRHRKPGIATLKKLAEALDVSFHVLAE